MPRQHEQDQDRQQQSVQAETATPQQQQSAVDTRPEAQLGRDLQGMANASPQAQEGAQLKAGAKEEAAKNGPKRKANKTGIPDRLKAVVEHFSGFSLDEVRVHYNSDKPAEVGAHAYAEGMNIYIAPGQEQHLAHEVWHVVQQMKGDVSATTEVNGKNVNDDTRLETEADTIGNKALQTNTTDVPSTEEGSLEQKKITSNNIQLRAIAGDIHKTAGQWETRGASETPATINNTTLVSGTGPHVGNKVLLSPTDGFIWGHLVKAAWDGGNDLDRLTLWNQAREDQWTVIEQAAQDAVNAHSGDDCDYDVNVTTEDTEHGNLLLGPVNGKLPRAYPDWYKLTLGHANNNAPLDNVRNALNTVITSAKMIVTHDGKEVYNSGDVNLGKAKDLVTLNQSGK